MFESLCAVPVRDQLTSVLACPLSNQAKRSAGQCSLEDAERCDLDSRLMLRVLGVEMWRRMVETVHPYDDAVELADTGHVLPLPTRLPRTGEEDAELSEW